MKKNNKNTPPAIRRDWGMVKPCTKAFKSKRDYNRKDKSWKKDLE